ncbi:MAG: DUF3313 domain-containing protein [Phycisphaerales bacterium]|jgi:hypothetical protein|nr:DUF3313 domain-containing protein [Phycisphaerales bacterium]
MGAMRNVCVFALVMLACVGMLVLGGCDAGRRAGGQAPNGPAAPAGLTAAKPSGWLSNPEQLTPSPFHEGALFYQAPSLGQYSKFYVDAISVIPMRSERGVYIDSATSERLSTLLRDAVLEELDGVVTIVHEPGPGVATIRGAITRLARSRADRQTLTGGPARQRAGDVQVGGAAMEVEIIDSQTRQRLAAAIESDTVSDPDLAFSRDVSGEEWYDAKVVFQHWAARLRLWLQRAQRGE